MNFDFFNLNGKTAVVTGGAGYLGQYMAKALASYGAEVIIWARNEEKMKKIVDEINMTERKANYQVVDLSDENERIHAVDSFEHDKLDILVNNAYSGAGGTTECSKSTDFQSSYDISCICAYELMRGFLPHLRRAALNNTVGGASVINIGSMYGMVSPDLRVYDTPAGSNPPFYGAAKAALLQLTKYWACEFGKERIRVNGLSFGPFPNDAVQKNNPGFCAKLANRVPLGRIGKPIEAAGPLVFLASDASSFVNGTNLVADGGWNAW